MTTMTHEEAEQYVQVCSGCNRIIPPSEVKKMNHLGLLHDTIKGGCGSGRVTFIKLGNVQEFLMNQGGI